METNNKLREAVVLALSLLDLKESVPYKTISQKDIDFMKAALAEPMRNCDVGTLEDRREQFKQFCKSHSDGVACDRNCPLFKLHINGYSCHFEWGELPFESKE